METSLHRQLKRLYAGDSGKLEVRHGRYRIDAVRDGCLIEIQHSGLAALSVKIRSLLDDGRRVLVVKPIVARKRIIKYASRSGEIISTRRSPKRGRLLDLFYELVHFTRVFPHRRLALEIPMVEIDELRYPGHGRRRRRRASDFEIADQKLVDVIATHRFTEARDLTAMLPKDLPSPFDTAALSTALGIKRNMAQRVAFCLRTMNAVETAGKRGNSRLYRVRAAA